MAPALRSSWLEVVMPSKKPNHTTSSEDQGKDEPKRSKPEDDRGYEEAARGRKSNDTDPDSPDADIDRDDMIDEP
jgi:hypothetical protein